MKPPTLHPGARADAGPVIEAFSYQVRLAEDDGDVRLAQRLRFEVFNLELGEGLEASYRTGFDEDPFDPICDHLLVTHKPTGTLVGTYRLQTGLAAAAARGYYSEQEFDLGPFEPVRHELVELGRACVHRDHRQVVVLSLLWRGIAAYASRRRARYLMGCSSLSTLDPVIGWAAYAQLCPHLAEPRYRTRPQPGWECPSAGAPEVRTELPRLLGAYLGLGAKICSPPACDREFGTIDFLTFMDLEQLHPAARRRFFG